MADVMKICTINFWEGFTFPDDFLGYLLRQSFGHFETVDSEDEADIVFTSIFVTSRPAFPRKTIAVIWENHRPNFDLAHYSISSDFGDYGGRNVRCPLWHSHLQWPGFEYPAMTHEAQDRYNHGFEPLIPLENIGRERSVRANGARNRFCVFVAGNPEMNRLLAVEALSSIEKVDVYGNVSARPLRQSKLEILPLYNFNICFENSMFPGYYTEKILHAWASGCVPLYFADRFFSKDFNPSAAINRADFVTLDDFVKHVQRINDSHDAQTEIVSQALVLQKPSLDPVINFIRNAYDKIKNPHTKSYSTSQSLNLPNPIPFAHDPDIALEVLRTKLAEVTAQRDRVESDRERLRSDLAALTADRQRLQSEVEALTAERARALADLERLFRSRSWRVTAPLRALTRMASRGVLRLRRTLTGL